MLPGCVAGSWPGAEQRRAPAMPQQLRAWPGHIPCSSQPGLRPLLPARRHFGAAFSSEQEPPEAGDARGGGRGGRISADFAGKQPRDRLPGALGYLPADSKPLPVPRASRRANKRRHCGLSPPPRGPGGSGRKPPACPGAINTPIAALPGIASISSAFFSPPPPFSVSPFISRCRTPERSSRSPRDTRHRRALPLVKAIAAGAPPPPGGARGCLRGAGWARRAGCCVMGWCWGAGCRCKVRGSSRAGAHAAVPSIPCPPWGGNLQQQGAPVSCLAPQCSGWQQGCSKAGPGRPPHNVPSCPESHQPRGMRRDSSRRTQAAGARTPLSSLPGFLLPHCHRSLPYSTKPQNTAWRGSCWLQAALPASHKPS